MNKYTHLRNYNLLQTLVNQAKGTVLFLPKSIMIMILSFIRSDIAMVVYQNSNTTHILKYDFCRDEWDSVSNGIFSYDASWLGISRNLRLDDLFYSYRSRICPHPDRSDSFVIRNINVYPDSENEQIVAIATYNPVKNRLNAKNITPITELYPEERIRSYHSIAMLNNNLLIIGGNFQEHVNTTPRSRAIGTFPTDPRTVFRGIWEYEDDVRVDAAVVSARSADGSDAVYVFGGAAKINGDLFAIDQCHQITQGGTPYEFIVRELTPMPTTRCHHTAVYIPHQNRIMLIGGFFTTSTRDASGCWYYDITKNKWIVDDVPNLNVSRGLIGAVYSPQKNRIMAFGSDPSTPGYRDDPIGDNRSRWTEDQSGSYELLDVNKPISDQKWELYDGELQYVKSPKCTLINALV
jgi:hypothetical protein